MLPFVLIVASVARKLGVDEKTVAAQLEGLGGGANPAVCSIAAKACG